MLAREVVAPGGPAYRAVADRFGPTVVRQDGRIDRDALARVVFADPAALADLNSITHPAITAAMAASLAAEQGHDRVVVLDIPLLTEGSRDRWSLDGVIVVDAPVEVTMRRLMALRGMDEAQARARIAAQATRQDRLAIADFVIDNSGDMARLDAEVDKAWAWVLRGPARTRRAGEPPRAPHIQ